MTTPFEIRVVPYSNDSGSYWVVQKGRMVNGRWKTKNLPVRAEKLFCIEQNMTSNEAGEYEAARKRVKLIAEQCAMEWRNNLTGSNTKSPEHVLDGGGRFQHP